MTLLTLPAHKRQEALVGYLFIAPYLVLFVAFVLVPVVWGFFISLHNWHVLGEQKPFVGFANYRALLRDDLFGIALLNTGYFALLTVLPGNAVSLLLALGLNARIRGEDVYKAIFYLPVILSVAVVAIIWRWMYSTEFGLLNYYLKVVWQFLHLPGEFQPVAWLNSPQTAMPSLAVMSIWWAQAATCSSIWRDCAASPKSTTRRHVSTGRVPGEGSGTSRCPC